MKMQNDQMWMASNQLFGTPEVVRLIQVPVPVPQKNKILVRVHAATVSTGDARLRSKNVPRGFGFIMGLLFGFKHPKYKALGANIAGQVANVGDGVRDFQVGDRLVADLGMKLGGHAEYVLLHQQDVVAKLPPEVSFIDGAALVFGGLTALLFLRDKVQLKSGERLLVIGAGGEVGSSAVQLGVHMGAQVTAVCSGEKVSAVKKLGAHNIIDYQKQNWTADPDLYDVIFDSVGVTDARQVRHKLSPRGRLVLVVADLLQILNSAWISLTQKQKVIAGAIQAKSEDLQYLVTLCQNKHYTPLIGNTFPFKSIGEAHRLVDSGHKLGCAVLIFEGRDV